MSDNPELCHVAFQAEGNCDESKTGAVEASVNQFWRPAVRAHVTLCMLALLLERTIERRVKLAGMSKTAAACFEELEPCRLNLITSHPELAPAYVVTEATQEQLAILRNMRISSLVDREEIASAIHPRTNP